MASLFHYPDNDWKKLFRLYYQVEISEQFIYCADNQLSPLFERLTGLDDKIIWLLWEPNSVLEYKKAEVSKLSAHILFRYGKLKVNIRWQSSSGRIYDIGDTDIDCNDISFSFEDIDIVKCNHLMNPIRSLFTFPESAIETFKSIYHLDVSLNFITCADQQLTKQFIEQTGIKPGRLVGATYTSHTFFDKEWKPLTDKEKIRESVYQKGELSGLFIGLHVNSYTNPVLMVWESKSGRIYEPADENIDCNDIKFWFDGLDPILYHKQLYPKEELPFKLKNISYDLAVKRINIDCAISLMLKESISLTPGEIISRIDNFIGEFNLQSEKKNRKYGVVHNSSGRFIADNNSIEYLLDLGSTGTHFMKKLLEFFSALNCFLSVEVG